MPTRGKHHWFDNWSHQITYHVYHSVSGVIMWLTVVSCCFWKLGDKHILGMSERKGSAHLAQSRMFVPRPSLTKLCGISEQKGTLERIQIMCPQLSSFTVVSLMDSLGSSSNWLLKPLIRDLETARSHWVWHHDFFQHIPLPTLPEGKLLM
jgi:hypothetical protein